MVTLAGHSILRYSDAGHERVVIAGGDEDTHRLPGGEGVGEEPAGIDARALVLIEVAGDRHCRAVLCSGQASGRRECLAESLPPAARKVALAAHRGECPVEVQVGEVEKTNGHALLK